MLKKIIFTAMLLSIPFYAVAAENDIDREGVFTFEPQYEAMQNTELEFGVVSDILRASGVKDSPFDHDRGRGNDDKWRHDNGRRGHDRDRWDRDDRREHRRDHDWDDDDDDRWDDDRWERDDDDDWDDDRYERRREHWDDDDWDD